jgi:flagellar hook-length control protein FliK
MTAPIAQALTNTANFAAPVSPKTDGAASGFDDVFATLSHGDAADAPQPNSTPVSPAPAGSLPPPGFESGIAPANVADAQLPSGVAIQPPSAPAGNAAQEDSAAPRKGDARQTETPISNSNLALRVRASAAYADAAGLAKALLPEAAERVSAQQANDANPAQSPTSTATKAASAQTTPQAVPQTIDTALPEAEIPATNSSSNPGTVHDRVPGQTGATTSKDADNGAKTAGNAHVQPQVIAAAYAEAAAVSVAPAPLTAAPSVQTALPEEHSSTGEVALAENSGAHAGANAPQGLEPALISTNSGATSPQAAPQLTSADASAAEPFALPGSAADAHGNPPTESGATIGVGASDAASASAPSTAPALAQTAPGTPFNPSAIGAAAGLTTPPPSAALGVSVQAPAADPKSGKLQATPAKTTNRADFGAAPSNAGGRAQPSDDKTDSSGLLRANAPAKTQDTPSASTSASAAAATPTPHPASAENLAAANPVPQTSATPHIVGYPVDITGAIPGGTSIAPASAADAPLHLELTTLAGLPDAAANMAALALRIAAKSGDGESEFTVRLDPPELGRIEVTLNINSQGAAQANLTADKPATLELLQRDAPVLERALKDIGLDLAGGLSFSLKSDGQPGDWRDAPMWGQANPRQIDALDTSSSDVAAVATAGFVATAWGADLSRLDIRV